MTGEVTRLAYEPYALPTGKSRKSPAVGVSASSARSECARRTCTRRLDFVEELVVAHGAAAVAAPAR